ncbi:hypothetical protein AVEN_8582-1, partial [Araneus ventricosus]
GKDGFVVRSRNPILSKNYRGKGSGAREIRRCQSPSSGVAGKLGERYAVSGSNLDSKLQGQFQNNTRVAAKWL